MKTNIFKLALIAMITILASCSNDDEMNNELTGTNDLVIEFDNGVNGDDLILGASSYINSNGESLKIDRFNYVVSNFVLIDAEGNEYVYPKNESYFVISEEAGETEVILKDIPARKYTAIKFGIGVDQKKYQQGAEGQGDFLSIAEAHNMMWSWQAGYKFLNFEGQFTSASVTEATNFKVHMGSHGSSLDNYKEVNLDLNTQALVSSELSPIVHLMVDANKVLDGQHKIKLSEKAVVMVDEVKSPQVAENLTGMFLVDHVHNGDASGH
ncbi:hypothetical protein ML462_11925 [Gramella lutea]|uniref:Copper-binding protein MbnP-like domain-containing protein n=1 Tax=Christiangramia lutea TaxID=1607951 RepID=A0A9X1V4T0_9FLAO|nr:MbnP family protein [Christiangramia lutea]MCH4823880.1 hypothetical protein [Christiangramia lutea]